MLEIWQHMLQKQQHNQDTIKETDQAKGYKISVYD